MSRTEARHIEEEEELYKALILAVLEKHGPMTADVLEMMVRWLVERHGIRDAWRYV